MKVLYISKALVVASYQDKIRALAARVSVSAVVPAAWPDDEHHTGPATPLVSRQRVWFAGHNHLHMYSRPAQFVRRATPDLVHVDEEPYSAVTFQLVRLCRRLDVPVLFFAWQNHYRKLPTPFRWTRRYVVRRATGAIAGSRSAANVLRRCGCHLPTAVIPQFGIDPVRFAPDPHARARMRGQLGLGDRDLVLGFAGRLVPEKGLYDLLEAARGVDNVRVLLIGDGPLRDDLRRRSAAAGLNGQLELVPRVPSMTMCEWLNAMDIAVLPSRTTRRWREQFGRFMVEAMACGVPVVATDSGEIPRVLDGAGIIVPEGNVSALRAAVERLVSNPEQRVRLARLGRARVLERYTQDRVADDTVAFYRRVLAKRHAPQVR